MRIEARMGHVIASNGAALVLAAALLLVPLALRLVISPFAFWIITAASAAALGAEVLVWACRGVRVVETGPSGITVYRGPRRRVERIGHSEVTRVVLTRRLGRRRAVIRLRPLERAVFGLAVKLPRRLVLPDDAFRPEGFSALLEELEKIRERSRE